MNLCFRASFAELPPTHEARVTVFDPVGGLGKARSKVLRTLRKECKCELFWIWEWSDGVQHLHILIRLVEGKLNGPVFGKVCARALGEVRFSPHCAPIGDVDDMGQYVVKTGRFKGKLEMPPRSFVGKLYHFTSGFFCKSRRVLEKECVAAWKASRRAAMESAIQGKYSRKGNQNEGENRQHQDRYADPEGPGGHQGAGQQH
jgi:hypothetical protein